MATREDVARRAFLADLGWRLRAALPAGLRLEYRVIPPFGSEGLILTLPGRGGDARVVAMSLHNGTVKEYSRFPGSGVPHYELTVTGPSGTAIGASGEHLVTCDRSTLISALSAWATAWSEPPSVIPEVLGERDLAPLRQLASARARIRHTMRELIDIGTDPHSEAAWQVLGLVRADAFLRPYNDLPATDRARLDEDLRYLAGDAVLAHFPRDDDGRLELGVEIPLASYGSAAGQQSDLPLWLLARAPKRRRDPQAVALCLGPAFAANHAHRWDRARWCWDSRAGTAPDSARWGVAQLALERLGSDNRAGNLAYFEERCTRAKPSLAERASLCILLQDEGRIEEAFGVFGIELEPDILRALYGQPLNLHDRDKAVRWALVMQRELRRIAPWRLQATLRAEAERLAAWAGEKPGRRKKPPHLRLFSLPHQIHQRKASLILTAAAGTGAPRLAIAYTASNARLEIEAWVRPADLDLRRFKLEPAPSAWSGGTI